MTNSLENLQVSQNLSAVREMSEKHLDKKTVHY